MLILVNNRLVLDLKELTHLTFRYIYEKETLSVNDHRMLERSLRIWQDREISDEEYQILLNIVTTIDRDARGLYEVRKETFKRHGINWKKFHKLV